MLTKVKEAEDFLQSGDSTQKKEFLAYMDRWIGYFQHERFVHLMVTLFFALFSILVLFAALMLSSMLMCLVFLLFAVTTGFYVNHYYLLENKTQYLYELYDEIEKK
jgi:hypothetical protein